MVERPELDRLICLLREDGLTVVGPSVQDDTICYRKIGAAADLPVGWSDRQEAGRYRAVRGTHRQ